MSKTIIPDMKFINILFDVLTEVKTHDCSFLVACWIFNVILLKAFPATCDSQRECGSNGKKTVAIVATLEFSLNGTGFTQFSKLRESDKSLQHELGSI